MRPLALYLRSRGVPAGLAVGLAGMLAVAWPVAGSTSPQRIIVAAAIALAFSNAVLSRGLGGHDVALDTTAAIRWTPCRGAHLAGILLAVTGATLVLTAVPAGVVVRDAAAFTGLAALAATLFGRHLAWTLPAAAAVGAMIPAVPEPFALRLLTWTAQPAESTTAAIVAATLAVLGIGVYLAKGPRHTTDNGS